MQQTLLVLDVLLTRFIILLCLQRLASGITTYQSRLLQVVNEIMAPVPLTRDQQVRQCSMQHFV